MEGFSEDIKIYFESQKYVKKNLEHKKTRKRKSKRQV